MVDKQLYSGSRINHDKTLLKYGDTTTTDFEKSEKEIKQQNRSWNENLARLRNNPKAMMDLSRTIARTDAHKKLNEKAEDNRNEIALNIQRLDSQKERIEDLAVEAKCHRIAAASVAID